MAFPTIPTVAAGRVSGLNQLNTTATLTGPDLNTLTGRAAGDLVIAIAGEYQSNAGADAAFTGWAGGGLTWTEIRDSTGTANGRLGVAYARLVTGSETGAVTVTRSGTLVGDASMILLSIPGAHASTAPEASVAIHANNAAADPSSLDPAGWDAEDTLWIGVNGNGLTSGTGSWTANNSAPANYTDFFGTNPADTSTIGDFGAAVAFRQLNAASEDMGGFGQDTSNARSSALLIAVRPAAVPQFDQAGFIGRNDNGTLVTATQKAAENVKPWSQLPDEVFRIRFVVDETAGVAQGTQQFYQLRYNRNGLGWNNVDAASAVARTANSAHVTNAEATARLLSSGTGTFHAGEFDSNNGLATGNTFAAGELTEVEYSLQLLGTDVTAGDLIDFRVERSVGGALEAYTQVPTVTVIAAATASFPPPRTPYRRVLAG